MQLDTPHSSPGSSRVRDPAAAVRAQGSKPWAGQEQSPNGLGLSQSASADFAPV